MIRTNVAKMTLGLAAAGMMIVAAGCAKNESTGTSSAPAPAKPALSTPSALPVPAQPALDPATVLVSIDGVTLTAGEVDKQLAPLDARMGGDPRAAAMKGRYVQQIVDRFVIRTVLAGEATRKKISVADDDVVAAMGMITNRLPPGMTLDDALARDGVTKDQFRTNLMDELRIKKLVESEIPTNTTVSDAEVTAFYESQKERFSAPEQVSARHILIKTDKADSEQALAEKKAKAEALRKQLVEGGDFAKLARENSDCPSKENGGDLGEFGRGQMVKPFEDAAFSQATNAIGPVVQTDFGYHIIQVTAHKQAGTTSLDEVKPRLTDYLKQKKQMALFETYLNSLKSKAKIEYHASVKPQPKSSTASADNEQP